MESVSCCLDLAFSRIERAALSVIILSVMAQRKISVTFCYFSCDCRVISSLIFRLFLDLFIDALMPILKIASINALTHTNTPRQLEHCARAYFRTFLRDILYFIVHAFIIDTSHMAGAQVVNGITN